MKQNQRIIKTGDYYELQINDEILNYQKLLKKDEPVSSPPPPSSSDHILTKLPTYQQARVSYFIPKSISEKENKGLLYYQQQLQNLLKQPLKSEEKIQIDNLLKEISEIKDIGEVPLNDLPSKKPYQPPKQDHQQPQKVSLQTSFSLSHLQNEMENLQKLNITDVSRLEFLFEVLLGQYKTEGIQNSEVDEKMKEEVQSVYGHLKNLTCLNNIQGIVEKVSSNEAKFIEMKEWGKKTEGISRLNKQLKDEFENDELLLKELEKSFRENLQQVRKIMKKLKSG